MSDDSFLDKTLDEVSSEVPDAVFQIKARETRPIDFLMGHVMKKTQGKVDPKKVREMIKNRFTV